LVGRELSLLVFEYPRWDPKDYVRSLAQSVNTSNIGDSAVLALPENWISREPIDEAIYASLLEELYKYTGLDVLGGLAYINTGEGIVSRGLAVINGRITWLCEKVFPSKAVGERGVIAPGRPGRIIEIAGIPIGCIACVDVFYPELSRRLAAKGASLLYNPSLIPQDRLSLWHSVLATRASENTVFMAGVNASGVPYPDGRITGGASRVYSPRGLSLRGNLVRGGVYYKISLEELDAARERWAFYEDLIEGRVAEVVDYVGKRKP